MKLDRVIIGDCRETMKKLPAESVQCVVTSPPYWGLRDYDVDGQLGLEASPAEYVETMAGVFREVWRVLKTDGCVWLNLGDSYITNVGQQLRGGPPSASSTLEGNGHRGGGPKLKALKPARRVYGPASTQPLPSDRDPKSGMTRLRDRPNRATRVEGLKHKDLAMVPARVALALQADGWYVRSEVIWHKPSPMPESVTDRPTTAHEKVFLLSKAESYFYDAAAISERSVSDHVSGNLERKYRQDHGGLVDDKRHQAHAVPWSDVGGTRNARSVWTIASQPYSGAHFATMPPDLAQRCILAGSRLGDVVFDPFMGSGTVAMVAQDLGRHWLGCELNPEYEQLIAKRTAQRGLLTVGA